MHWYRWSRWVVLAVVVLVVGGTLMARHCTPDLRQAIQVSEGRVVVTNLTDSTWSNVEIWLNDYYRAQAATLLPDQRLEVPLKVFVGGYGRRFEPHRQQATALRLTARAENGERIALTWAPKAGPLP